MSPVRYLFVVCVALLLAGCAHGPTAAFEPFSRNKLSGLSRSIANARDAQQASSQHLIDTVAAVNSASLEGTDPGAAYDHARRALLTTESRMRNARERIQTVSARADELFSEWSDELSEYEDPALRRQAATQRDEVRQRFESALDALEAAGRAAPPLTEVIRDRVLFFKHNRSQPALPSLPSNALDPAPLVEALSAATSHAATQADAFIASVPPETTPTPATQPATP